MGPHHMNFPIPNIIDATLTEAIAAGCDSVMLKHDGWPVSIICANGAANIYSDFRFGTGYTPKAELLEQVYYTEPCDALLMGAKSRLSTTIWLYDCWYMRGQDVQNLPYRNRYVLARTNAKALDERFQVVQVLPIASAQELWREVMLDPDRIKGLVFRRSKDTAAGNLYVKRYYKEAPQDINTPTFPEEQKAIVIPTTSPSKQELMEAHQYLYYCKNTTVLDDTEYDQFCKSHNLIGGGGSDLEDRYSPRIKQVANLILQRKIEPT